MPRAFTVGQLLLLGCAGATTDFVPLHSGADLSQFRGRPQLDPGEEARVDAAARATLQDEWDRDLASHWRARDGVIESDGQGVYLTTRREFGDVELRLEYAMPSKGDSGIYLRANPQVQIWDPTPGAVDREEAQKGSGGLFNNQRFAREPAKRMDRPPGEWNALRVLQVGARTSVWLNGEVVVDCVPLENFFDPARPLPPRGPIQFQTHGANMRFREVAVREIAPEEANRILDARDALGFEPLFDGSFAGWEGAVSDYEALPNGVLRCRTGARGTLFTAADYGDFVVRLEFRLPEGGNNGLAIRYPGTGNASYDGMCEVQVLDDTAERNANLNDWQYCGSLYGQVPAARGYLRPRGEWNHCETTVIGHSVRVELNGTIVVDADLSKAGAPPSGRDHAGRMRKSGRIGLCSHDDPVEFRNLRVKRLEPLQPR